MFGCPTLPHTRDRLYTYKRSKDETRLDIGRNDVQLISKHSSELLTEHERLPVDAIRAYSQVTTTPNKCWSFRRGEALDICRTSRHGAKSNMERGVLLSATGQGTVPAGDGLDGRR